MTANEEASDFDYGTEPDIGVERFKSVKRGVSASPKPKKKIIPNKKTANEEPDIKKKSGPKSVLNPESSKSPIGKKNKKDVPKKKTAMEQTAIFDYDAHLAMHAKGHKPI